MKKTIYIVTAWRWGNRSDHSYHVGTFTKKQKAINIAEAHTSYRGGKYACTVEEDELDSATYEGSEREIIYKTNSMMDQNDPQLQPKKYDRN